MLKDIFVNQVIPQLLYIVITAIIGVISYYVKQVLDVHKAYIDVQKQHIIQKIGNDAYNQDLAIAKQIVLAVEQMGREFNWQSEMKHSRAADMITKKTGLSEDEIYNIIKATVAEFNNSKLTSR